MDPGGFDHAVVARHSDHRDQQRRCVAGLDSERGLRRRQGVAGFIAASAQSESDRLGLGLGFTTVFPTITPHGEVGRESLNIHAEQAGKTVAEYLGGAVLTPEIAGREILKLASTGESAAEYMLTGDGLRPL